MPNMKTISASAMLAVGAALLGYAIFYTYSEPDAPQWEPVNKRIEQALAALPSEHLSASPQPPATPSPQPPDIASPSPSVKSNPEKPDTPTPSPANNLLDLNAATQSQLEELPGIGPSKAKAIIAFREQKGAYKNVKQLLEVKGIGPKMLDKITPYITVQTPDKG